MKRLFGFLAFFVLSAVFLGAQTITVTKPAIGDTWTKGQSYTITWTKSGTMPANVRITLRNAASTSEVAVIADPAPNSGSYQWTVPASPADGQYVVRVKAKGATVQGDSGVFSVAAVAPVGTITILDPTQGSIWREGRAHEVRWAATGSLSGNYAITLMDSTGTNAVATLFANAVCCGCGTAGPVPYVPGLYRVRVKNIATNTFTDSPVLTLSPDTIILTQPGLNSSWLKGRAYNITWTKTGNVPATVKIELDGAYHQVLAAAAPNTGSFSWTIPSWMPDGQYWIKLTTSVLDIYSNSSPFKISNFQFSQTAIEKKIIK
jgi:hypothetical protein